MNSTFSNTEIPGMGAINDTLDFVKKLWGGMQVPGMVAPAMSADDLDKQIQDLKTVESWLNVNMNMLRGTIQALEVQRATMAALNSLRESFTQQMKQAPAADVNEPSQAWPMHATAPEPTAATEAVDKAETPPFANPAAWWGLLQDQFTQAVGQALESEALRPSGSASVNPKSSAKTEAQAPKAAAKPRATRVKADAAEKTKPPAKKKTAAKAAPARRSPAK